MPSSPAPAVFFAPAPPHAFAASRPLGVPKPFEPLALERAVLGVDAFAQSLVRPLGTSSFARRQGAHAELQQGLRWQLYTPRGAAPGRVQIAEGAWALRLRAALGIFAAEVEWGAQHLLAQLRRVVPLLGAVALASPRARATLCRTAGRLGPVPYLAAFVAAELLVGQGGAALPLGAVRLPPPPAKSVPREPDEDEKAERARREFAAALATLHEPRDTMGRAFAAVGSSLGAALACAVALFDSVAQRGVLGTLIERPLVALAYALEQRVGRTAAGFVWGALLPLTTILAAMRIATALLAAASVFAAALVTTTLGNALSWGLLEGARLAASIGGRMGSARAAAAADVLTTQGCEPVRFRVTLARDPVAADAIDAQRLRGRLELPLGEFAALREELVALAEAYLPRPGHDDSEREVMLTRAHTELHALLHDTERGRRVSVCSPEQCRAASAALYHGSDALVRDHVLQLGQDILPAYPMSFWVVALWCRERKAALAQPPELRVRAFDRALCAFVDGVAATLVDHTNGALLERSRHALHQLWVLSEALAPLREAPRSAA